MTVSRVLAAVCGGLALTISATICLAVCFPPPRTFGAALALALVVPAWTAAMCVGLMARSARRVWIVCLGGGALLGAAAWLLRRHA
jgi:hypothetical protein